MLKDKTVFSAESKCYTVGCVFVCVLVGWFCSCVVGSVSLPDNRVVKNVVYDCTLKVKCASVSEQHTVCHKGLFWV